MRAHASVRNAAPVHLPRSLCLQCQLTATLSRHTFTAPPAITLPTQTRSIHRDQGISLISPRFASSNPLLPNLCFTPRPRQFHQSKLARQSTNDSTSPPEPRSVIRRIPAKPSSTTYIPTCKNVTALRKRRASGRARSKDTTESKTGSAARKRARTLHRSKLDRAAKIKGKKRPTSSVARARSAGTSKASGSETKKSAALSSADTLLDTDSLRPSELEPPEPIILDQPPIARLHHGLERVLFNPGVYRLQDPLTKVYNFDPDLADIMDVNDFDFNALTPFRPPSKDKALSKLARSNGARYIASTSSLTAALCHFHFLLSRWRPINLDMLSRGFQLSSASTNFTQILRAAGSIDLTHHHGILSVNSSPPLVEMPETFVLSRLGHILEKMLTSSTSDLARYRKDDPFVFTEEMRNKPEHYHFAKRGKFLTRAQLDAYDPRLPGSGTFDIKSRAALSIRMQAFDPQEMLGYQIDTQNGTFESFEREYHDMLRAIMLKYSLQVRLGNMTGVFAAYHNIEEMFGFHFIHKSEMDLALHGQTDPALGDQELSASMHLLEKFFDRLLVKFPKDDMRIYFEARPESPKGNAMPFMYICAETIATDSKGNPNGVYATMLRARSTVDRNPVTRVENVTDTTNWQIEYKFEDMTPDRGSKVLAEIKKRREEVLYARSGMGGTDASLSSGAGAASVAATTDQKSKDASSTEEATVSNVEGVDIATAMSQGTPASSQGGTSATPGSTTTTIRKERNYQERFFEKLRELSKRGRERRLEARRSAGGKPPVTLQ